MNALQSQSVQNLPVIFWQNQAVITTDSLASVYEVDVNNIQANFNNNKARFEEGKHFFKLEGESLREFKKSLTENNSVSRQVRNLILWTERGTVRHAKMLGTDQAWDVQEKLEQFYFSQKAAAKPVETAEALPPPVQIPLSGTMIVEFVHGEAKSCKPLTKNTWIFDAGNEPGIRKLVNDYIPAQSLSLLMNAAMERMQAIALGKTGSGHA